VQTSPGAQDEPVVLDIAEVATNLRVSRRHIYRLVARGELRVVRLGRRVLVPRSELERLLDGDPPR
jgi:excisionase family DNA binding protein